MKRIIAYLLATAIAFGANAAIKIKKDTFKEVSSQHHGQIVDEHQQLISKDLTAMHISWPTDAAGNLRELAAVEFVFFGLPPEELDKIQFTASPTEIERVVRQTTNGMTATLFVPVDTKEIKLTHPQFGSDSIHIEKSLWPQTLYRTEAELEALHTVTFKADADPGVQTVLVTFGNFGQKVSPATFENVPNGTYPLVVGAGTIQRKSDVTVGVTSTRFDSDNTPALDLRHRTEVVLKTKGDKNTQWFVDGEKVGEGDEVRCVMTYGPHNVRAEINKDKYDERSENIDAKKKQIWLSPQARKTLEFSGLYNGQPVATRMILPTGEGNLFVPNHKKTFPADKQEIIVALEDAKGHKGKKSLKVTENTNIEQKIKLKSGRAMVWPWESDYKTAIGGWEVSYVTKQIAISGHVDEEDDKKIETSWNGVWGNGFNHWLHGVRTGFHIQPAFKFGLGLYTGVFGEFYFSHNDNDDEKFKDYLEIDISAPLHILYQFPLGRKIAVGFHTGPSFNWSVSGVMSESLLDTDENSDSEHITFGEAPYPKAFSVNWDFSLWLRFGPISFSGTVSKGMSDLGCFPEFGYNAKSVMKKYILGLSIVF